MRPPSWAQPLIALLVAGTALPAAAAIDVVRLQQPWPRQRTRTYEVGKYPIQWRQAVDKTTGLCAGVRFTAPLALQATWDLAQDYRGVGQRTPGVEAVRFKEDTPGRQLIELDVTVLWRNITLQFLVERDAPHRLRFELLDSPFGVYRGYAAFAQVSGGTVVELATQLQPAHRVPARLLLFVERLALLGGARAFLEACERQRP